MSAYASLWVFLSPLTIDHRLQTPGGRPALTHQPSFLFPETMDQTHFARQTADPNCPPGPLCFDTRRPPTPPHPTTTPSPDPSTTPSVWRSSAPSTYLLNDVLGLLSLAVVAFVALRTAGRTSLGNLVIFSLIVGGLLYTSIIVEAASTDGVCDGPTEICLDASSPEGPTDTMYSSSPPAYLLSEVLRLVKFSLLAFVAFRMFARTSLSSLIGLGLIIGGFLYDATRVQAASNTALLDSLTTLNTSATALATPVSRFWDCHGVVDCPYPGGPPGNTVYIPSSTAASLLSEVWRVAHFTLVAFLASRVFTRRSHNALLCFCLAFGGFAYQFTKSEAAETTSLSSATSAFNNAITTSTTAVSQSMTTALNDAITTSVTAVSRIHDCKHCKPTGHSHPHNASSPTMSPATNALLALASGLVALYLARKLARQMTSALVPYAVVAACVDHQIPKVDAEAVTTYPLMSEALTTYPLVSPTIAFDHTGGATATASAELATTSLDEAVLSSITAYDRFTIKDCNGVGRCTSKYPRPHHSAALPELPVANGTLLLLTPALTALLVAHAFVRKSTNAFLGLTLVVACFACNLTGVAASDATVSFSEKFERTAHPYPSVGGRFASPSLWLVLFVAVSCLLAFAAGQLHGVETSAVNTEKTSDYGRPNSVSKVPTDSCLPTSDGEDDYSMVPHFLAGRMFSERKPSKPEDHHLDRVEDRKEEGQQSTTDDTTEAAVDRPSGYQGLYQGLAVLIDLLLLATLMFPMALAESTTTRPALTLSRELMTTPMNAAQMGATTQTLHRNDRPQSWIYRNDAVRSYTNPLLILLPCILVGNFVVPALIALAASKRSSGNDTLEEIDTSSHENLKGFEKINTISTAVSLNDELPSTTTLSPRMAQTELPPVWITYYTTTTVWPPAMTAPAPPCTQTNPGVCPIVMTGNPWEPPAAAICTEPNQAVCPIVLGWKDWRSFSSAGRNFRISKAVLSMLFVAGFFTLAVAQAPGDLPVYLPVEPTVAAELVERSKTLYRNGSVLGAGSSDLAGAGWAVVSWACAAGVAVIVGFFM